MPIDVKNGLPPPGLTFVELVNWRFVNTRPMGTDRAKWSVKDFASKAGVDVRTVRYWRSGTIVPKETDAIERAPFGMVPENAIEQRLELRNAHFRACFGDKILSLPFPPPPPEKYPSNIPIRIPKHFLGLDDAKTGPTRRNSMSGLRECVVARPATSADAI